MHASHLHNVAAGLAALIKPAPVYSNMMNLVAGQGHRPVCMYHEFWAFATRRKTRAPPEKLSEYFTENRELKPQKVIKGEGNHDKESCIGEFGQQTMWRAEGRHVGAKHARPRTETKDLRGPYYVRVGGDKIVDALPLLCAQLLAVPHAGDVHR